MSAVISFRLWPAENTVPWPLITMDLTVLSSAALVMSSVILTIISSDKAFLVLGESRLMFATPLSTLTEVRDRVRVEVTDLILSRDEERDVITEQSSV